MVDGHQAKEMDTANGVKQPAKALFNKQTKEYSINVIDVILNTEQVKLLNNNITTDLKFKYKGKEYEIQYRDEKIHGNKLPYKLTINELQKVFGVKVEYYYTKACVEILF